MAKTKLVNGVKLDYVAGSFASFAKINNSNKELKEENIKDYIGLMKFIESKLKGYINVSTLFNAYQEEGDGRSIKEHNNFGYDKVYSDSGGLQVLTAGKTINDEVKEKVYTVQAKYSDYAMTFDEMPIMIAKDLGKKSKIGDYGQVFVDELVEQNAELSAKHIQKQIDMFESLNASTKILPIIHGYDIDSYLRYAKSIFNNLDHIGHHIQGMSIASLSGHADNKVGIMKVFDFVPKILNSGEINPQYLEHIHLLGVASSQRIIPIIMMIKKGLLPIKTLSFDSTAITKAYTFGRAYQTIEEYKNPRDFSTEVTLKSYKNKEFPNIKQLYQSMYDTFKDYENFMFDDWEDIAKHSPNNGDKRALKDQFLEEGLEYQRKYLQQVRIANLYHHYTYISMLEGYIDDELSISELFGYNKTVETMMQSFESVNTLEELSEMCEYFYHFAKVGRTDLRIKKVKTIKEFKEKYEEEGIDVYAELGIDKDVEILSEELKKPWIKSSIKRAKGEDYPHGEEPTNALF